MADIKFKLTVNAAQAEKIRCLVGNKKNSYPILSDPKSGITIQPTDKIGPIEVPYGLDYTVLQWFVDQGLCYVSEGQIGIGNPTLTEVSFSRGSLTLSFSDMVYASEEINLDDLLTIMMIQDPDDLVLSLETTGVVIGDIATAIAALAAVDVFEDYDLVVNGATITFTRKVVGGSSISPMLATGGTGVVTEDELVQDIPGNVTMTLAGAFIAGETISPIDGETITFYADNTAKGADTYGVAIDPDNELGEIAIAIAAMTFTNFDVEIDGVIPTKLIFTQKIPGTGVIAEITTDSVGGTVAGAQTESIPGYIEVTLSGDFIGGERLRVADEVIYFYPDDDALADGLVEVLLHSDPIAIETNPDDLLDTKEFIAIANTEDLNHATEILVTFKAGITAFEDEDGNATELPLETFTVSLAELPA